MSAIETLRAILVGAAVVAAVVAVIFGLWFAALVLVVAVGVHGWATLHLRRVEQGTPPADAT